MHLKFDQMIKNPVVFEIGQANLIESLACSVLHVGQHQEEFLLMI